MQGGSSPHARGTPGHVQYLRGCRRFIPACAGNAYRRSDGLGPGPVHPRMRGERVRCFWKMACKKRFIPACAGNAAACKSCCADRSVHPRMRGERPLSEQQLTDDTGSSPHARGTLDNAQLHFLTARFIPACAGNAPVSAAARLPATVHPRMRGERRGKAVRSHGWPGSSPHARGTLLPVSWWQAPIRFIPACAGNA